MTDPAPKLRARTWIAPGLPLGLFELVVDVLAASSGRPIELDSDPRTSGPGTEADDVFARAEIDLGFVCTPSYLWLRGRTPPSVCLVGAATVFSDPRAKGRPVYFAELVTRAEQGAARLADLSGRRWGYNDATSMSGYYAMLRALDAMGEDLGFFDTTVCLGSHERVLEALVAGDVDVASVDANVHARLCVQRPALMKRVRVVETWGPFPVQPIVVRSALSELAEPMARALCASASDPDVAPRLRAFGVHGFAPITEAPYEALRPTVESLRSSTRP